MVDAYKEFGLTISLKKTEIMFQDINAVPNINISDCTLQFVEEFPYLGSAVSNSLSLNPELKKQIGKAAAAMARLS